VKKVQSAYITLRYRSLVRDFYTALSHLNKEGGRKEGRKKERKKGRKEGRKEGK
jgi:hypothetical protein